MSNELFAPSTLRDIQDILKDGIDFLVKDAHNFSVRYNFATKEYVQAKTSNLSEVKLAFYTTKIVNLLEVYVPQSLTFEEETINQDSFLTLVNSKKRFIISATAGAGKSCMLQHLFLSIVKDKKPFFPLFYKLRNLNDQDTCIVEALVADIALYNNKFNNENLKHIFKRDNTVLFLDGFDEIDHNKKQDCIKDLNKLSEIYPKLNIVITSRPEHDFHALSLFHVAEVQPLNVSQATAVIKNLRYDSDVSQRFIDDLNNKVFEEHRSFASNPLLLTIMLITYEQYGEIPSKMHIFYDEAYRVLFNRHDSYKQGYKRDRRTGLDIKEFEKVFSLFCFATYFKNKFVFDEEQLEKYLHNCLQNQEFHHEDPKKLKEELTINVPLMAKDGLQFVFSHRSFQEYFTALYLSKADADILNDFDFELLEINSDFNVLGMLFDISRKMLENRWVLPRIQKILHTYDTATSTYQKLLTFYLIVGLGKDNNTINLTTHDMSFFYFLRINYSNVNTIYDENISEVELVVHHTIIDILQIPHNFFKLATTTDYQKELLEQSGLIRRVEHEMNFLRNIQKLIVARQTANKSTGTSNSFIDSIVDD